MQPSDSFPDIYQFSAGYYIIDGLDVEPTANIDIPVVTDQMYGYLQEHIYGAVSTPMMLRHNESGYHFRIQPSDISRSDMLRMPSDLVSEMELDGSSDEQRFLLAKPNHAYNIYLLSNVESSVIR